jgi:hypothetical protein
MQNERDQIERGGSEGKFSDLSGRGAALFWELPAR